MEKIFSENKTSTKGIHIITLCKATSFEAESLVGLLESLRIQRENWIKNGMATAENLRKHWEEYRHFLEQLHNKFKVFEICVENVTVTVGRSVLAQRLSGTTTYTGVVNYGALGTNNTAPVVGNTTLGTETYRKALSSGTFSSNIAYLENFYTASEVSGTFEEYGFFIDGTGSANTGQLFNRFTQTVTKSVTETLNVQSQITINDA